MPNPKRRHSNTRRDKRRTHYKATAPTVVNCGNCGAPVLWHRVCGTCGFYRKRQVTDTGIRLERKRRNQDNETDLNSIDNSVGGDE